ncbi:MAG: ABC transporter substrate-binding protein [Thermodesulfobacteriota bacterium]|jgi:branched-chain amino acid transport system substrate-binding protein
MKKTLVLLVVVLMGVTLGYTKIQAADPIYLGFNDVRSGPFKSNGDKFLMGIEVAVKELNKTGGLLGRPIELVVEDNQMKPEIAVQKLRKLIQSDKCEAIFQGSSSAVALSISQAMPRYKKIYVPVAAFAVDITGKHFQPYMFRTDANTAIQARTMAMYLGKRKEFKKVYMINMDYAAGHDAADYYQKFIKEIAPDTEIVGNDFHPMFNKDFAPYISKIKASGADYVLTQNWGTDLITFITQARSLGLKIPMAGILMADINAMAAMPGEEAVGNFGVASFIPGLDTPEARKLEESFYEKSGGTWPVEQVWYAYKGVILYAEAVKKAGSLDADKVIKAFEGMKWNGPTGTVTMRAKDHQLMQPMIVGQVVKKTKYYDHPYLKPIQVIPAEQLDYKPEDYGWKPYKE